MWLWLFNIFLRSGLVAVLMSSKGIQLDMKRNVLSLLSHPSHIKSSFFNKVRFDEDTKRKTFALPTLAHKDHLWLDDYAALYILIMHRKWNFFNNAAQGYRGVKHSMVSMISRNKKGQSTGLLPRDLFTVKWLYLEKPTVHENWEINIKLLPLPDFQTILLVSGKHEPVGVCFN